ncbi:bifunctional hydroxymethylpyrimidine kinase/phosphomethylpyrimidine kinase [Granulicella sp. WH15]|nr:bifunctional hydroxymethylpyrimidine kinase/phosphomethylpyrimidine kinase [Granulicella sp. WH15]
MTPHKKPQNVLLTIAGFDPSSGAGVTADLAVFAALGCFGVSCITALTVQSTLGVEATHPVAGDIVAATLDCLNRDIPAAGVKIGMLATEANVGAVASFLERLNPRPVVVLDPVLRSSSGRELLSPEGVRRMQERLLPLVDWVTPNLDELAVLTGLPVGSRMEMAAAAGVLQERFPGLTVLATGGHLDPPDDLLLQPLYEGIWLPGVRVESSSTHGTGCALSSALLAWLVRGNSALEAAQAAKQYVTEAIRRAPGLGGGHGPLGHYWPLQPDSIRQ